MFQLRHLDCVSTGSRSPCGLAGGICYFSPHPNIITTHRELMAEKESDRLYTVYDWDYKHTVDFTGVFYKSLSHHHAWQGIEQFKSKFMSLKPTFFPHQVPSTACVTVPDAASDRDTTTQTDRPENYPCNGPVCHCAIITAIKHVQTCYIQKREEARNLSVHVICHHTLDDKICSELLEQAMHVCIYIKMMITCS